MKLAGTASPVLNRSNLQNVTDERVQKPQYDINDVNVGIVHIGPGKFFSSHLAMYINHLMNMDGAGNLGISAVSIRRPSAEKIEKDRAAREKMAAQDHLYTLYERSKNASAMRIVGSVREVLAAYDAPQQVMARFCSPDTKVVSMTITPDSYKNPPVEQTLDNPQDWMGYVLTSLLRRREAGIPPFTLLSCDNIVDNGKTAKRRVLELAEKLCPHEIEWLEQNLRAPNTVVDRITPEITPREQQYIEDITGHQDVHAVVSETFHQFIIEKDFGEGFPQLEKVPGVSIVDDARPYESMKLWQLNGSHRAIAYIGFLRGLKFVHEAFDHTKPDQQMIGKFIAGLMEEEMLPSLPEVPGYTADRHEDYINVLLKRFADSTVNDQVTRIGENGSTKLSNRIFDPIREQLARGGPIGRLAFVTAAWIRYISGVREDQVVFDFIDTYAKNNGMPEASRKVYEDYVASDRTVLDLTPILAFEGVFGKDLPKDPRFVRAVSKALKTVYDKGIQAALADFMPIIPPTNAVDLTQGDIVLLKYVHERQRQLVA